MYLICYVKPTPLARAGIPEVIAGPLDLPLSDAQAHELLEAKLEQVAARYVVAAAPPAGDTRHRLTITDPTWHGALAALQDLADRARAAEIAALAFLADRDWLVIPRELRAWWSLNLPGTMKLDLAPTAHQGRLEALSGKRMIDAKRMNNSPNDANLPTRPEQPTMSKFTSNLTMADLQARMDRAEVASVRIRRANAVWIVHLEAPTAAATTGITDSSPDGWPQALDLALAKLEQQIATRLGRLV